MVLYTNGAMAPKSYGIYSAAYVGRSEASKVSVMERAALDWAGLNDPEDGTDIIVENVKTGERRRFRVEARREYDLFDEGYE